jgi:hypothetical protein
MMEEKQRKRAMRFGRKNLEGIYRLDAGVWRGPGEQIIPLTSLQQKIALLPRMATRQHTENTYRS